jgi:hypothetical protein
MNILKCYKINQIKSCNEDKDEYYYMDKNYGCQL